MITKLTGGRLLAVILAVSFASAGSAYASPAKTIALTTATIMQKMIARNAALQSFQAHVHVNGHLLSFPWLRPTVDGTAYYRKPNYSVVFDKAPSYAKSSLKSVFSDLGDPSGWYKEWNVSYIGRQSVDGHQYLALRLTKRIYSDQLKDTIAYVDPASYEPVRFETHRRDGGWTVMTQSFANQSGFNLVTSQHAEIQIPHVHAILDATYEQYRVNVPIADSIFAKDPNGR